MSNNRYMTEYVRKRYIKLKLDAIAYKGGKCKKCGYDKCPAAMVFHHRDPKEKEFEWAKLRKRSWEIIKKELDKCDLMCCRCHTEEHYDPLITEDAIKWLENKKQAYQLKKVKGTTNQCVLCGKTFIKGRWDKDRQYCSGKCAARSQERANWPPTVQLRELVGQHGQVQVGKMLGVSARAVKKRLDKCGR